MAAITISDLKVLLQETLKPINDRLDAIDARLDRMDTRLGSMDTQLDRLEVMQRVSSAKISNSMRRARDRLDIVPLSNGTLPNTTVDYPHSFEELIVAENEMLPLSGLNNPWNSTKSLALIRLYDPAYETDDDSSEASARRRRLEVARHIGITGPQLNFAHLSFTI